MQALFWLFSVEKGVLESEIKPKGARHSSHGSLLIELVVALSIGLVVILQLSTFMVGFVREMHSLATTERRLLQEGVVLDLLMQDLSVAARVVSCDNGGVELQCWRMREKENPGLIMIVWRRTKNQVQRRVDNSVTPQVFGDFLVDLDFEVKERRVYFADVCGKKQSIGF